MNDNCDLESDNDLNLFEKVKRTIVNLIDSAKRLQHALIKRKVNEIFRQRSDTKNN